MPELLFELPPIKGASLQTRIREMLVSAILDGHIPLGTPLPSGRRLAEQLHVARNTVVLAYQHLVDEGFLVARERSGYYVNEDILRDRVQVAAPTATTSRIKWSHYLHFRPTAQRNLSKPANWQQYPYPFVYGQIDPNLFPTAEWRECCRDAASIAAIHAWSSDRIDQDDPELVEQIHTRVLPRRGVWAQPEEILVTLGAQQALYLIADLLLTARHTVAMEDPGYPDARNIFTARTAQVQPLTVDGQGLVPGPGLSGCQYVYVTPSHQFPTTVTLSRERRELLLAQATKDSFLVIEDDYESELNFRGEPTPALKSLDREGVVIYVGSLSKTLAPGLRMGFMVAPAEFIREARALRRLMTRHPPANNQLIVAQFLRRGYHDALIRRLSHVLKDRWQAMHTALTQHLPGWSVNPSFGGSSFWLQGPAKLDARRLQEQAAAEGIFFEAGDVFFLAEPAPTNYLRLGFSSIAVDRIEPGIARLAQLVNNSLAEPAP